jgi:hypothetical protein
VELTGIGSVAVSSGAEVVGRRWCERFELDRERRLGGVVSGRFVSNLELDGVGAELIDGCSADGDAVGGELDQVGLQLMTARMLPDRKLVLEVGVCLVRGPVVDVG